MRSKGGEKVESEPIQAPSNDQATDEVPSIDACASLLAMMDERAYQRILLCSANQLSREILEPLSLPWMHKGNPVTRNMPFDLDDMAEILMADDGSYKPYDNGPLGFGRFDVGQFRRGPLNTRLATSSDSLCSASRRSDDPGILEISTVTLPPFYTRTAPATKMENDISNCDSSTIDEIDGDHECVHQATLPRGELSLRCYEYSSTKKRRKIATVRNLTKRYLISVRVNSSSSRATIFHDLPTHAARLLLDATLPAEVHSGRTLSTAKAQVIAENLGTYDWRHGLSNASNKGKSSNRLSCGRTRLIWTEKSPSDQPQKVFFSSLLTGARIEGAHQKRPRDIKLAIRLEGELFNRDSLSTEPRTSGDLLFENFPKPSAYLHDAYDHPNAICMMDDEELTKNIINDASKALADRNKSRGKSIQLQPVLDCLPDANGLIGVVCTSVGKIALSSIHECFNRVAKEKPLRLCTVCWAPDVDQDNPVKECSECGVLVHPLCCYEKGETLPFISAIDADEELIWKCAVCCYKGHNQLENGTKDVLTVLPEQAKKSKRKSRLPQWLQDSHIEDSSPAGRSGLTMGEIKSHGMKCVLCPYEGGAMSHIRLENESVWMHEVCRTWLRGRKTLPTSSSTDSETVGNECALCGQGEKRGHLTTADEANSTSEYVLKCAASRCQVYFHPMCGLLSSKLVEISHEPRAGRSETQANTIGSPSGCVESPAERDRKLCSSFTLTALDCEVTTGSKGNDLGTTQVLQIPIAFCGIHNPKREASYRGLYPAGRNVSSDVMRIPALR